METKTIVITKKPKTFHFDLLKDVGINLKHEKYFLLKHNEILADYTIKEKTEQLLSKY